MPVRPEPWPHGTPAWVDLMAPDLDAARDFYRAVLGWELHGEGDPAVEMVYLTATKDGTRVASIGSVPGGARPRWTTYLATADIHATAAAALAAGGTVLVPPTDAEGAGQFALLADPTGAVVGLWQSGWHTGADLTGEPGSMTWHEEMTGDVASAQAFYAAVFGYTFTDISGPGFTYATFEVAGVTAGGIGDTASDVVPASEPFWRVYFKVADVDAAVDAALAHGGSLVRDAWDSPFGRIALVRGPGGEDFALLADLLTEPGAAAVSS